jgi:hypothetical protein
VSRSTYLRHAEETINHVRSSVRYRGLNTGAGWIRHPTEVNSKFAARIQSLILGSQRSAQYKGGPDPTVYVTQLDRLATETQTGNCSELSAVAFTYLEAHNVTPLDYFGVERGTWNHAFVILNRDATIPLANFAAWSHNAVICDPLYDRSGIAAMAALWYRHMLPLKDRDVWLRAG